ncbi:CpaF family protein [Marinimicrobium sp. C2-29]|uniref:CpaF family protein n=1 Tax=Marinimicrobium sp. C2-29 TaxID=3139825 RepID=UPI00313A1433
MAFMFKSTEQIQTDPDRREPAADAASEEARQRARQQQQVREWKRNLYGRLMKVVDLSLIDSLSEPEARAQIREICQRLMQEQAVPLNHSARAGLIKEIEDEMLGLGPLEPLLADASISDILINGAGKVYIERGGLLELTDVVFNDDAHLLNIIDRIVSGVGRRVDESSPMVDARLQDGSRVNVIIPPLALDGPTVSIRRFGVDMLTMDNLVEFGTLTGELAQVLQSVVQAKLNVLISGGTGSGKTTLLNILSGYIPSRERIVTIEDSAELQLRQPHVVRLETRPANVEHRGEVSQRDLVRNSLRMRPDRIVIGEVRGAESLDMLQAMNTGHDGSLTTIHANTPRDALGRVENMVMMTGIEFPPRSLRSQIASALDVVVQVERQEDGKRRVVSVQEINGMEGEIVTMSEIFTFRRHGLDAEGKVIGEHQATGIVPNFYQLLQQRGIDLPIELFRGE